MTSSEFNQVMILTDNLFSVMELDDQFWIVNSFSPADNEEKLGEVSYNSFKGICVTELIKMQKIQLIDKPSQLAFLQTINRFIDNKSYVNVKFGKYERYKFYSKS